MVDPVQVLMDMKDETVSAKYLAPIVKMSESVIVKYAKEGKWDQDKLCKFVISGGHVKFFRKDFLQKCGFMEYDEDEPSDHQLLDTICTKLDLIIGALTALMNQEQRKEFVETFTNIKTAGAGTPTD